MYVKLKEFRLQQNLSVSELSRLSNVSANTIRNIELNNSTTQCKMSTIMKLVAALDTTLGDLVDIHS